MLNEPNAPVQKNSFVTGVRHKIFIITLIFTPKTKMQNGMLFHVKLNLLVYTLDSLSSDFHKFCSSFKIAFLPVTVNFVYI